MQFDTVNTLNSLTILCWQFSPQIAAAHFVLNTVPTHTAIANRSTTPVIAEARAPSNAKITIFFILIATGLVVFNTISVNIDNPIG